MTEEYVREVLQEHEWRWRWRYSRDEGHRCGPVVNDDDDANDNNVVNIDDDDDVNDVDNDQNEEKSLPKKFFPPFRRKAKKPSVDFFENLVSLLRCNFFLHRLTR